jgi:hypothetical protein
MVREYWRDPRFWRWFWHNRIPSGAKVTAGVFAAAAVLVGGFFAAARLSGARASVSALTYDTTLEKAVTVREHGKTLVRRVPVVRRVFVRPQTSVETRFGTRFVTTPGGIRLVPERIVKLVPVVRRHVITVNGKTQTITNQQTVVDQSTVTVVNSRTVTAPVTVTESRAETVVQTETLPPVTVTVPLVTVTATLPVTVTIPLP